MAKQTNTLTERRRFLSVVASGALLAMSVGAQAMLVRKRKSAIPRQKSENLREEVAAFTRDLARLTEEGSPLVYSMQTLAVQQQNPALRAAIEHIQAELEAGSTLSHVMSQYPDMFDDEYVARIVHGENNGTLEESLHTLAQR